MQKSNPQANWHCFLPLAHPEASFQRGGTKLERFLPKDQHTQSKSLNFENCINGVLRSFSKSEAKPFLFLYSPFENSTTRIAITQICTHSYITLTVVAKNLNDKSGCQLWLNLAWAGLAVLFCRQMDFSNFSGLRSFFKMETNARTFEALFLSNTLLTFWQPKVWYPTMSWYI